MEEVSVCQSSFLIDYRLLIGKCLKAGESMRLPYSTIIHAAKRQLRMCKLDDTIIDTNTTRAGFFKHFLARPAFVAKEIQCQWLRFTVDDLHCSFYRSHLHNRQNRAEYFFLHDQ